MLIQQLVGIHPGTSDRFYRTLYESLLDPRLLTTSKQALYLNLVFKALHSDLSEKRVKAFVKRLLQVASLHQASFASAVVYLVRELESVFRSLKSFTDQMEVGESDDEEVFVDAPEESGPTSSTPKTKQVPKAPNAAKGSSRISYDGRKRDPQHSNAENSCLWELVRHIFLHISYITLCSMFLHSDETRHFY